MKRIALFGKYGAGKLALVDDDLYDHLLQWRWHANERGYPYRSVSTGNGRSRMHFMHWDVLTPPPGMIVDHLDRDPLNNQRSNLRVCTHSQNSMNVATRRTNKAGLKGVYPNSSGKWRATVYVKGSRYELGTFETKHEAALSYNEAARKYHGEFAFINSIPPQYTPEHKAMSRQIQKEMDRKGGA